MKDILQDLSFEELEQLVKEAGAPAFRARQISTGLLRGKKISEINIDGALKGELIKRFEDEAVRVEQTFVSSDGTKKYLFALSDGSIVEGVLMRYSYGNTACVSTQAGCAMGCKFCASTLGGLIRNLTAGEILAQVVIMNAQNEGKGRGVTNVVLMGSGEPLDNYQNVIKFLKNLTSPNGLNISARNISLSTCGLAPKIYDLAEEGIPLNLTISLHATDDGERAQIMPIAKRYKIAEILRACEHWFAKTGRRYIFEYTLIGGKNDDIRHAESLARLLSGKPCHVNLIRLNGVEERDLSPSPAGNVNAFLKELQRRGISATLRRQTGSDIGGACGQLRAKYIKDRGLGNVPPNDTDNCPNGSDNAPENCPNITSGGSQNN